QDPVHVYFEADEQTWLRYSRDAGSGRDGDGRVVRVGLAGEDGLPHAGTLDFIDNQVDPATGTIRARAVLRNPDGLFTPGLFARVQLAGAQQTRALLVDDKAVLTDQDRKYVWVLGEDDTAQRRDVELGRVIEDGLRVVRAGLSPEDRVIVSGVQRVFMPGMPVAPTEVAMAPAGDADVVAQAGPRGRCRRPVRPPARATHHPTDQPPPPPATRGARPPAGRPAADRFPPGRSPRGPPGWRPSRSLPRRAGRRAGIFPSCRARAATAATAARTCPHGLLQVLHRPTHLRRGAVDRDLRRRPDLDPAASDRRIP